MDVEQTLNDMSNKSKEYLESISALELLNQAISYTNDLQKLSSSQHLPAVVMIGCLTDEINRLTTKYGDIILAGKLATAFKDIQDYVDKNFIKKEK